MAGGSAVPGAAAPVGHTGPDLPRREQEVGKEHEVRDRNNFFFRQLLSFYILSILTKYSWGDRENGIAGAGDHHSEENLNISGGKGFFSWHIKNIYIMWFSDSARSNSFIWEAHRDDPMAMDLAEISHSIVQENVGLPYVLLRNYYGPTSPLLWQIVLNPRTSH